MIIQKKHALFVSLGLSRMVLAIQLVLEILRSNTQDCENNFT